MSTDRFERKARTAYVNGIAVVEALLRIDHHRLDVTTEWEPDPAWTHIDADGHFHAWSLGGKGDDRLPTLDAKRIEEPCNGRCDDEVCEGYTRTEYRCRMCGEVIEPRSRRTTGRRYAPGLSQWSVDVELIAKDAMPLLNIGEVSFWTDEKDGRNVFGVGHLRVARFELGDLVTATIHGHGPLGERPSA